jgi:drug/metabolite transporter (DMT)-like permease
VATISSGWAVVTVALSLIFLHEMPEPWQQAGIIVTLAGVMLVAYRGRGSYNNPSVIPHLIDGHSGRRVEALGVLPALGSVLFFGSCYFLMKIVTEPLGPVLPILVARTLGVLVLSLLLLLQGELRSLPRAYLGRLAFIGLLDAGGFIAFNLGMKITMVSIVSPVASLLTLVTVLLARFYLGERMVANQQVGFWLTLVGVLLLSSM